jgi:hypothetical protein
MSGECDSPTPQNCIVQRFCSRERRRRRWDRARHQVHLRGQAQEVGGGAQGGPSRGPEARHGDEADPGRRTRGRGLGRTEEEEGPHDLHRTPDLRAGEAVRGEEVPELLGARGHGQTPERDRDAG